MRIRGLIILLALAAGCAPVLRSPGPVPSPGISNDDIAWEGTLLGLQPMVKGEESRRLLALGREAVPGLRAALAHPDKYAAAQVLLTLIEGKEVEVSATHWNGLRVSLTADGRAVPGEGQMDEIRKRWQQP